MQTISKFTLAAVILLSGSNVLATTVTLYVAQDTTLRGGVYSTISSPHVENLMVKKSNNESYSRTSLLKFRHGNFSNITKGILNLHLARSGATELKIEEVSADWEDTRVNWATQPQRQNPKTVSFRLDSPQFDQWIRINITSLFADRKFTGNLRIRNSNKALVLISSEESGMEATLELEQNEYQ